MYRCIFNVCTGALLSAMAPIALACGLLDDPNASHCMSNPGVKKAAGTSTAPSHPRRDDLNSGPPGSGQTVCAFYDRRTQKCLTERPNTEAYDSAVQTGIGAAMMGMQIQQDALHRARQMGIGAGVPGQGFPMPTAQNGMPSVPSPSLPHASLPPTPRGDSPQEGFKECVVSRLQQIESATGRPASAEQTTAAMQGCSR